jgi:type IX secretion system PorP/SprF family membrane protein
MKFLQIFLFCVIYNCFPQQDAQFTQYMYNTANINPAYAGSRGKLSAFVLHRRQWEGFQGAPITNTIAVNMPIEDTKIGLGLSIINDRIGPSDENNISLDFSYSFIASDDSKLSFGLKGSANLLNVDFNKIDKYDPSDVTFQNNIDNRFSPNIGVGFYYYRDNMYVGLSAPNLLETIHFYRADVGSNSHVSKEKINYYLISGYVFDLNPNLKFKPSILAKMVQGAPLQVDLSANFMINEKFVAGLAYRWSAAVSALAGFQLNKSWFLGYSYDKDITPFANYNSGTHEIFLRFELFKKDAIIVSPTFF